MIVRSARCEYDGNSLQTCHIYGYGSVLQATITTTHEPLTVIVLRGGRCVRAVVVCLRWAPGRDRSYSLRACIPHTVSVSPLLSDRWSCWSIRTAGVRGGPLLLRNRQDLYSE